MYNRVAHKERCFWRPIAPWMLSTFNFGLEEIDMRLGGFLFGALLLCLQKPGECASKRLTAEGIVSLRTIQGISLSPKGDSVVYVVNEPLADAQSKSPVNTELWLRTVDRKIEKRLTNQPGTDTAAQWSPDGSIISFLSDRAASQGIQIFSIDPKSGVTRQLTHHEPGISSYAWSPDGKQIAFVALAPLDEAAKAKRDRGDDEMRTSR